MPIPVRHQIQALSEMVGKKTLEVHVWINFKFALGQPLSFSQPPKFGNECAKKASIPIIHEK